MAFCRFHFFLNKLHLGVGWFFMRLGFRAQASIEFMALVGFLLVALVAFSALSFSRHAQFVSDRDFIEAKAIAREVAMEVDIAVGAGDGYLRVFELPPSLFGGTNFSAGTVPSEQLVEVNWSIYRFTVPILSANVEEWVFASGNNSVRNEGGLIRFA